MLSVTIKSILMGVALFYCYSGYRYAEYRYSECRYAERRGVDSTTLSTMPLDSLCSDAPCNAERRIFISTQSVVMLSLKRPKNKRAEQFCQRRKKQEKMEDSLRLIP
jgi:hypothetical protein